MLLPLDDLNAYFLLILNAVFLARRDEVQEELLYYPGVGVGVGGGGVSKMLKFYIKLFYVMGKALSGELSCPCDTSCYTLYNVYSLEYFRDMQQLFFIQSPGSSVDLALVCCSRDYRLESYCSHIVF